MLPVSLSQRAHCVLNTQEMSSPRYSTISHSFRSSLLCCALWAAASVGICWAEIFFSFLFRRCCSSHYNVYCMRCYNMLLLPLRERERDGKISDNYIFSLGKSERTKSETWTSLISFDFIYSSSAPCALSFFSFCFPINRSYICLWMNHWQVGSAYIDVWDE